MDEPKVIVIGAGPSGLTEPIVYRLRARETLKERKVEAPKPWERESWRRKKKGRT